MSEQTDFKPEMIIPMSKRLEQQRIKLENGSFSVGTLVQEKHYNDVVADINGFCNAFMSLTKRLKFVRVSRINAIYDLLRSLNLRGVPTNALITCDVRTNPTTEEEWCEFAIEVEIPPNVVLLPVERISRNVQRQIEQQKTA